MHILYNPLLFCFLILYILSSCVQDHNFFIEREVITNQPSYTLTRLFRLSSFGVEPFNHSSQGMDIYEDKILFQTGINDNIIHVLDINTKSLIGSFLFETPNGEPSHMNNINCGRKYFETDSYPLLYLSQTESSHTCYVIRLSNDATSYDLIQTINYNGISYHMNSNYDWFIDIENQFIYSYGNYNGFIDKREIVKFPLPSFDNRVVIFSDKDVIDHFILENMSIYQGSRIINGLLYAPLGFGNDNFPSSLKIIDLDRHSVVNDISIDCGEPESIGYYKKGAIICGGGKDPYFYYLSL